MIVGVLLSMALAYVIARPVLKLRGFVLAMVSLAMQLALIVLALEAVPLTGGALGTQGVPKFSILGLSLGNNLTFYYFVWFIALICIGIGLDLDHSRIGRALKAIAASEAAAGSVGIDVVKHKVQIFIISAAMASRRRQPRRALPAGDGPKRLWISLQPQPAHRGHHRRPNVGVGRRARRHGHHRTFANCCVACRSRRGKRSSWARSRSPCCWCFPAVSPAPSARLFDRLADGRASVPGASRA